MDGEKRQKKTRAVPHCTTCGDKVKGHVGQCGRRCPKRPLITLDERDDTETPDTELREVPIDDNEQEIPGDDTETETVGDKSVNEKDIEMDSVVVNEGAAGFKGTSTPKGIVAHDYIQNSQISQKVITDVVAKLERLYVKFEEVSTKVTGLEGDRVNRQERAENRQDRQEVRQEQRNEELEGAVGGIDIPGLPQEVLRVIQNREENRPPPVRVDRIPGLRPVPNDVDVRSIRPVDSIPDRLIVSALKGEYCELEHLISATYGNMIDTKVQVYWEDGQLMYKIQPPKKCIVDIVTWLESWTLYTRFMGAYHGQELFVSMCDYQYKVIDWSRKYKWPFVSTWDSKHRQMIAGRSVEFTTWDVAEFTNHFDPTSVRKGTTKCNHCASTEHTWSECPFRGNAGGRYGQAESGRPDRYNTCFNWNYKMCTYPGCRRYHVCKGCGGNVPYVDCAVNGRCARKSRY